MVTWLAALIAVAAITATYFSCVRPMLRGERGDLLEQRAREEGRPVADVVRDAVEQYLR